MPTNEVVVWVQSLNEEDMGYLVHELFHATVAILKVAGLKLSDDSEEAYSYLHEYLYEQTTK